MSAVSLVKNDRPFAAGFTLLEVLVAVSLIALLLLLGFATVRGAIKATASGEALIARTEEIRTAQAFLRRQFAQALPLPFRTLQDGNISLFEAERGAVQFVAPMPGYLSRGGAHVQRLSLNREGGSQRLEFQHAQLNGFDPEQPFEDARDPVVLLDGIARAEFSFRRIGDEGTLTDWDNHWDQPALMPMLIRVDIEFEHGDRRAWPEFEVAVIAAGDPAGGRFGQPRVGALPNFGPSSPVTRPRQ